MGHSSGNQGFFQRPLWLDAVAPGQWKEIRLEKDGVTYASLPYVQKKRYGLSIISVPRLTPYLGPWWCPIRSKSAKRLGKEKDIILGLIDQLPQAAYTYIACNPSITNLLPFHWRGFSLRLRYTYRIEDVSDPDQVWSGFRENIRTDIRKARKQLVVRTDLGFDRFDMINALTFSRQGKARPYSQDFLRRVDGALSERNCRQILFAVDAQGRVHAVNYTVWDDDCAYYLMGGADPELRNSGAQSLLMWEAIQRAASVTRMFDFEGSMIEPVERFFRAFGAKQTPYYVAVKAHPLLRTALTMREWITRVKDPLS
jgi:Acetyltransferase (GNAT) domain